jgi:hypothetical protein
MATRVEISTAERLRLKSRSNGWLYFPAGLLFVFLGSTCLWIMGYTARIQVQEGRLNYSQDYFGVWRTFERSWRLEELEKISVETLQFWIYASMEVHVYFHGGPHLLALPSADGDQKEEIAAQLERARRGELSQYSMVSSTWVPGLILAVCCFGGGIICWSVMETITFEADAVAQVVRIRRRRLLWPIATITLLPLGCLASLQRQVVHWRTKSGYQVCYHIILEDNEGCLQTLSTTPLFTDHSSSVFLSLVKTWLKQHGRRRNRTRQHGRPV